MTATQNRLRISLRPLVRETMVLESCPAHLLKPLCDRILNEISSIDDQELRGPWVFGTVRQNIAQWIVRYVPRAIAKGRVI
jgi:hypothetical protein